MVDTSFQERSSCPRHWYALQTKARHEKVVRDRLERNGLELLLPTTHDLRQWSDRKKRIEMPVFPGYCFAKFSLQERGIVLQAAGVSRIVGVTAPEPIPDEEIEAVRKLTLCHLPCQTCPYIVEGTPVEVIRGPLAGVKGCLIRKAGQHHLLIRVRLIQQAASVHIDADDVAAIVHRVPLSARDVCGRVYPQP